MNQLLVCDQCGQRIEIEDSDNLEPVAELIPPENDLLQEQVICDNCAPYHLIDKA